MSGTISKEQNLPTVPQPCKESMWSLRGLHPPESPAAEAAAAAEAAEEAAAAAAAAAELLPAHQAQNTMTLVSDCTPEVRTMLVLEYCAMLAIHVQPKHDTV